MNEKGCTDFAANWHKLCTVQGDETVNSWVMRSKVIKGHGRTTPKLVLETRRRHHSVPLRSSTVFN